MKNKYSTKMIVEAGIMIALATALSYVKLFQMPNGGSVTAGSTVPLIIFAIRWGTAPGFLTALVFGVLQFLLGPKWSFHPVSILFDYVFAYGVVGLSGMFGKDYIKSIIGIVFAGILRIASQVISGVVVFASFAPEGQNVFAYSLIYNATHLIPELIVAGLLYSMLYKPLTRAKIVEKVA
ncbi:MAG: energy-coupled thiamine transporter ThiT [Acidaminobacteraceae bacterium]